MARTKGISRRGDSPRKTESVQRTAGHRKLWAQLASYRGRFGRCCENGTAFEGDDSLCLRGAHYRGSSVVGAFLSENLTRQHLDESVLRFFQSLGYGGMHLASHS